VMSADEIPWRGLWHRTTPAGGWRREVLSHGLVYLIVPLVVAMFGLRADRDPLGELWIGYQRAVVVLVVVAGLFELQYRLLWPRLIVARPGWPARVAGHVVAIALAVVPGTFLAAAAFELLWGYPAEPVRTRLWPTIAVVSSVVVAVQVVIDEMTARSLGAERRAAQARVAALRAELAALQARTDPHFLFNSLNTVAALIPDEPALAERTLERLATVFRYAIDAGRRPTVDLADELRAVEAYLDIEATRLGDRLRWRVVCEPGLERLAVPPLALQPLAENAVRHGAQRRRGATVVDVSVRRTAGAIVLAVEDQPAGDGGAPAGPARPGAGTALADLSARVALAVGDQARVEAGPAAPAGWRAAITVPAAEVVA